MNIVAITFIAWGVMGIAFLVAQWWTARKDKKNPPPGYWP